MYYRNVPLSPTVYTCVVHYYVKSVELHHYIYYHIIRIII